MSSRRTWMPTAATLAVLLVSLTAACGRGARSSSPSPSDSVSPSVAGDPGSRTGRLRTASGTVTIAPQPGEDGAPGLVITGATLALSAGGGARLDMAVRNLGSATDHLVSVTTPRAGGATLVLDAEQRAAQAGQPPNDDGVSLAPGKTLVFGGTDGPSILLRHPAGLTVGADVPVVLYFANVGLVHLTVNVTSATR